MSFLDKLRDRTRNLFRKQPHYGSGGSSSSNTAHQIVNKTEKAVYRGTHGVSKAAHTGINKANKTAHQIEKESKSFWKKTTKG
uniref:Uncharacterized protein n=1 Tax=Globodera pallida TaxID=36090 RepID=A0A183C0X4_GLOPA